jgi:Family of unknown function (DUF6152)
MTRRILRLAAASLMALATPALAHHAVQSEFDVSSNQQIWKGTLKEMRSVNPHTHLLVDVDDPYAFVGYQACDGSKLAFLESLTGPTARR